jgi:single-strand DNA-binding protein
MPRGANQGFLIGYVAGEQPQVREFDSGNRKTVIRVGVPNTRKGHNGSREDTQWETFSVTLWGDWAVVPFLTRGKQVFVQYRLQPRTWEDAQGNRRYVLDLVASDVILLGSGGAGNGATTDAASQSREPDAAGTEPDWLDDIPF